MTVLTAYNADGNVSAVTAVNSSTGNQVTQFVYGTTLSSSGIASSLLKSAEVYPDSVGGSDQVTFTYNRQGEPTTVTDQNGTVHAYDYDGLGRRTQDCVTALGTGIDAAVLRIGTTYEVRGMAAQVTSYDNARGVRHGLQSHRQSVVILPSRVLLPVLPEFVQDGGRAEVVGS